jgi:hypothetical protein
MLIDALLLNQRVERAAQLVLVFVVAGDDEHERFCLLGRRVLLFRAHPAEGHPEAEGYDNGKVDGDAEGDEGEEDPVVAFEPPGTEEEEGAGAFVS